MTRIASLTFALAALAIAIGSVVHPPDRASADYNITGGWTITLAGGEPCPTSIVETYSPAALPNVYVMSMVFLCDSPPTFLSGDIDGLTGHFIVSGLVAPGVAAQVDATASSDNHTIDGTACLGLSGSGYCTFTYTLHGTGGDGLPKPGPSSTATATATPLPSATPTPAPPPVGGVSFDVITQRNDSNGQRWLIVAAGVTVVALGGAALYARRRRG